MALDRDGTRNRRWIDWWSLTHVVWGVGLSLVVHPVIAFILLVAWEPFEVLVLSPLAARFDVSFGNEAIRNSVMDIVFDGVGVLAAVLFVLPNWDPLGVL